MRSQETSVFDEQRRKSERKPDERWAASLHSDIGEASEGSHCRCCREASAGTPQDMAAFKMSKTLRATSVESLKSKSGYRELKCDVRRYRWKVIFFLKV